jgi:hypothetical protein
LPTVYEAFEGAPSKLNSVPRGLCSFELDPKSVID